MESDNISKDDVLKFLALSRLDPAIEPLEKLQKELSSILGYISTLQEVNVDGIEPMTHANSAVDIFREDKINQHLNIKEFLKNAPDSSGTFFRVPLVIEEG